MKIFFKTLSSITAILIILTLVCNSQNSQIRAFASQRLNTSNRNVVNVAVLLYSFDDPFMLKLKQSLEDIEKENKDKVRFTFYDGKNNIAVQMETLDSILRGNVDLIIGNLANVSEDSVKNVVLRVKPTSVPLILIQIDPQVVSKVSKYYNKIAFISPSSKETGISEGKILVNLWNTNKEALDRNGDNILQYVLLKGEKGNPVTVERSTYVVSTINDSGIKTQELASINSNWSKELAKNNLDSLLLRYAGKIEAIISNNDAMAIGAFEALQKYGYNAGDKTKNIAVVGIDGLPEAKDLIDKGVMTGTVIQDMKVFAEGLYSIGMNLINNENPLENTNYKIEDGEIIIPRSSYEYVKK